MNQQEDQMNQRRGSILILALWTLTVLSLFAVYIGLRIQQRAVLLARLEDRSQLHYLAQAGIKKAIAALMNDLRRHTGDYTAYGKFYRHNNPEMFKGIKIGQGAVDVHYVYYAEGFPSAEERFGFIDEESKININTADKTVLKRLIQNVVEKDEHKAQDLAESIFDWRQVGDSQATGFYSDNYYKKLAHPYEKKNANFETVEELLLARGMSQGIFDQLSPFITIYGDGKVNINTAPREVLRAIGMNDPLIDKLFVVRRGGDGVEATVDDYVFQKTFDIASEMASFVKLDPEETKTIDLLNEHGKIKTNAFFYLIQSEAVLEHKGGHLKARCVYNVHDNHIEYWREKY